MPNLVPLHIPISAIAHHYDGNWKVPRGSSGHFLGFEHERAVACDAGDRPAWVGQADADRSCDAGADGAEVAGVVGVGRRDETPDELRRPSSADHDRFASHSFHERAIDVPLIDRRFRGVSMRLELLAPGALLARQSLQPVGAFSYLRSF